MTYFGEFTSKDCMVREFQLAPSDIEGCDVLFAVYEAINYEGEAWVLLRHDGELYTVHGSHCSCMGLEDQWKPELDTPETLAHQLLTNYMLGGESSASSGTCWFAEIVVGLSTMERARVAVWIDAQLERPGREDLPRAKGGYPLSQLEALQAVVMGG